MVRTLNPDVRIVLRMFNQNLIGRLGQTLRNGLRAQHHRC